MSANAVGCNSYLRSHKFSTNISDRNVSARVATPCLLPPTKHKPLNLKCTHAVPYKSANAASKA